MMKRSSITLAALFAATHATSAGAAALTFTGHFSNDTPPPTANAMCTTGQIYVSFSPANSTAAGTSNFGDFGPSQSHCITLGQPYRGVFSFDFAAGDMLSGTTAGFMTPTETANVFNSFVTYTVTTGTGRFAGATGVIDGVGLLDRRPMRPLNDLSLSGTLHVAAVPEPATWAMLVAGFGVTGAAMRRRQWRLAHAG
jgi:hypothetical protein